MPESVTFKICIQNYAGFNFLHVGLGQLDVILVGIFDRFKTFCY